MKPNLLLLVPLLAITSCQSQGQQKANKPSFVNKSQYAKEVIAPVPTKSYPGISPASMAPDVQTVDADEICTIINGAILIKKGSAHALVDVNGKFLVPWGKYLFDRECDAPKPSVALFKVKDTRNNQFGYINTEGKVVIPCIYHSLDDFDCFKLAAAMNASYKNVILNLKGQEFPPAQTTGLNIGYYNIGKAGDGSVSKMLYSKTTDVYDQTIKGSVSRKLYGYASASGAPLISAKFVAARQFSDGMAAVMQIDQFGEPSWGYIDESGKLVIPYTYSIEPGDFHEGLALVMPKRGAAADFNYAYIDKTGTIKIKIGDGKAFRVHPANADGKTQAYQDLLKVGQFAGGVAIWRGTNDEVVFLDQAGNFQSLGNLAHVTAKNKADEPFFQEANPLGILFKSSNRYLPYNNIGLMTTKGELLFPPNFNQINPDYYSPYAIANVVDSNSHNIQTTGVINKDGVFVLVLAKKAIF